MKRLRNQRIPYALLLLFTSFVFLLLFSCSTSPLYPYDNGTDASFFRLVGQGMNHGFLPYRDFFDMKGPVFFFVEALAQSIWEGRYGIFLIQVVNLFLSLLLADRTIDEIAGKTQGWKRFLALLPSLTLTALTFENGNGTEEFSLLPLFLCLYLAVRTICRQRENTPLVHRPLFALIYGFCFGLLAFIRINNAALICAIVFVFLLWMIRDRQWLPILKNAGMFLVGLVLASLPFCLYYGAKGLLGEMLECVFSFGFLYASEDGFAEHLQALFASWMLCIPTLLPVFTSFLTSSHRKNWVLLSGVAALATLVACGCGNAYYHYFLIGVPLSVLGFSFVLRFALQTTARRRLRAGFSILLAIVLLFSQSKLFFHQAPKWLSLPDQGEKGEYTLELEWFAQQIPVEEKQSVLCHNVVAADAYLIMDVYPCNRYCMWQEHYVDLDPEIGKEISEATAEEPIQWILAQMECEKLPDYYTAPEGYSYEVEVSGEFFNLWHLTALAEEDP